MSQLATDPGGDELQGYEKENAGIQASFEKIKKVHVHGWLFQLSFFFLFNLFVDIQKINMTLPLVDVATDFQE